MQSANINFMIGSSASRPYLATLCSVETWLTKLTEDKKASSNASEIPIFNLLKIECKSMNPIIKRLT